jgi:hypothetical protein
VREDAALGCAAGRAVSGGRAVTLSPDGRSLYAAGLSNSIAVFGRNRRTGALHQLRGAGGCVVDEALPEPGCALARGLVAGRALLARRRHLYAGSLEVGGVPAAVAVFRRGRRGALRQLPGARGCLTPDGSRGCVSARALRGVHDIVPRPGRRELYVVGSSDHTDGGIAVLRPRRDGSLRQLRGVRGCFSPAGEEGCAAARGLLGGHTMVFSADGNRAWTTAEVDAGSLSVLAGRRRLRHPRGPPGCMNSDGAGGCTAVRALRGAHQAVLSPGERHLYVAALFGNGVVALVQNGPR